MSSAACATCRKVRRLSLLLGAGAILALHVTESLPFQGEALPIGFLWLAMAISALNIFVRLRQLRVHWSR